MRHKVFITIILLFGLLFGGDSLGISSKLDFGDSSPKLLGTLSQDRSTSSRVTAFKREEPKNDFDEIGVVCTSGGCNTTKSTNESKDSIETDVVVHVKTSVDLNKNQSGNKPIEDTPDVPVVVGLGGTEYDRREHNFNQRPLVVTNIEDNFPSISRNYHTKPSSTLTPFSQNNYVPSSSTTYAPPLSSTYIPPYSSTFAPSISSTFAPSSTYSPTLSTTRYTTVNHHHQYPSYPSYTGSGHQNVFIEKPGLGSEPRIDVNIKTLPPITLTMSDSGHFLKDVRYKTNGIEIHYPYFEPTYNTHYFGEHTPPQFVYYPKSTGNVVNPVEFKNIPKATWKPSSLWQFGIPTSSGHRHTGGAQERCQCKNDAVPGLQWYPQHKIQNGDPGTQINDKLAPLN